MGLLTSGAAVNPNLWASERDRLTQKAGTHYSNLVSFYKEKIDRDAEFKNMVLGKINVETEEVDLN